LGETELVIDWIESRLIIEIDDERQFRKFRLQLHFMDCSEDATEMPDLDFASLSFVAVDVDNVDMVHQPLHRRSVSTRRMLESSERGFGEPLP
jgi:hypothetical protein